MVEAHLGTHTHTHMHLCHPPNQVDMGLWKQSTQQARFVSRRRKGDGSCCGWWWTSCPPMFTGQEFDKLEKPIINCSLTYTNAKELIHGRRAEEFGFTCLALRVMEAVHPWGMCSCEALVPIYECMFLEAWSSSNQSLELVTCGMLS